MIYLMLAAVLLLAPYAYASDNYNGEDVTRPVTRFDTRVKVRSGVASQKGKTAVLTLRSDMQIPLSEGWQIGLRADAPF